MNPKTSIYIFLGILAVVVLFHIGIITKMIPYEMTWGGRLKNDAEMYVFESISILVNSLLGFLLLIKGGYVKLRLKEKIIDIVLWLFLVLFVINTVGNLFAKTNFEKSLAVLTFVSALLLWTILKEKNTSGINK